MSGGGEVLGSLAVGLPILASSVKVNRDGLPWTAPCLPTIRRIVMRITTSIAALPRDLLRPRAFTTKTYAGADPGHLAACVPVG
jgi:hypothetical protein